MGEALQQQQVQLSVSAEGIMRSLGDQFTRRSSFILELAQNARRAGASWVAFDIDDEQRAVTISDNGHGIDDPSKLLRVAESDWRDVDALEKECPFGIGLFSAIYSCAHITIETVGWSMSMDTADLLAFHHVPLDPAPRDFQGTAITLTFDEHQWAPNQGLPMAKLVNEVTQKRLDGFAIDVFVDGHPIERTAALTDAFEPFSLGYIAGLDQLIESRPRPHGRSCYLQGLPIAESRNRPFGRRSDDLIVHLDEAAFRARVPDRDQLVNPEESRQRLDEAIKSLVRERLLAYKRSMDPTAFVERYTHVTHNWAPDLLDNAPLSPLYWFRYQVPACAHPDEQMWQSNEHEVIQPNTTGAILAEPQVVDLSERPAFGGEHGDCDNSDGTVDAAYAWVSQLPVVENALVQRSSHWVSGHAIRLDQVHFDVEIIEAGERQWFEGHNSFWVRFCKAIRLTPHHQQLEPVELTNAAIRHDDADEEPVVIVPVAGEAFQTQATLLQGHDYLDEFEQFQEEQLEADEALLDRLRAIAAGSSALDLVARAIRDKVSPSLLQMIQGRSLTLHVENPRNVEIDEASQLGADH